MEKNNKTFGMLVVFVVLLAAFFFYRFKEKALVPKSPISQEAPAVAKPAPVVREPEPPITPAPDPLAFAFENLPPIAPSNLDCPGIQDKALLFQPFSLDLLKEGKEASHIRPISLLCVRAGGIVIATSPRGPGTPQSFNRMEFYAQVTSLETTSFAELAKRAQTPLEKRGVEILLEGFGENLVKSQPLIIAKLRPVAPVPVGDIPIPAPIFFRKGRVVNRAELAQVSSKGAVLIDARPAKDFARGSLKKAINLPVEPDLLLESKTPAPSQVNSFVTALKSAAPNPAMPVVFFGEWPGDFAPVIALRLASEAGYSNLFWFWEGMDWPTGQSLFVPMTISGATTVTAKQAIALGQSGAKIIDVRDAPAFLKGPSLPGSRNIPYVYDRTAPPRRPTVTVSTLKTHGESMPLEGLDPNSKIVFVGRDAADWRTYKAVLFARAAGFKSISWVRDGVTGL